MHWIQKLMEGVKNSWCVSLLVSTIWKDYEGVKKCTTSFSTAFCGRLRSMEFSLPTMRFIPVAAVAPSLTL